MSRPVRCSSLLVPLYEQGISHCFMNRLACRCSPAHSIHRPLSFHYSRKNLLESILCNKGRLFTLHNCNVCDVAACDGYIQDQLPAEALASAAMGPIPH